MRIGSSRKGEHFYFLLNQNAMNVRKAGRLLQDLMGNCEDVAGGVAEIAALERFGDEIAQQTAVALHSAKSAPVDRRDLSALADALDGVVDGIGSAANSMLAYGIDAPTERSRALADAIAQSCAELEKSIGLLPAGHLKHADLLSLTGSVKARAAAMERSSGGELAPHFAEGQDPSTILKWRDIYGHLKHALTQTRSAADVVEWALTPRR